MRASRWSRRSTTALSPPIICSAPSGGSRLKSLGFPLRSMTRACITIRCATAGPGCARPTENSAKRQSRSRAPPFPQANKCGGIHSRRARIGPADADNLSRTSDSPGRARRAIGRNGDLLMTQAAKAQEPSMEEILASIRRIIAADEGKPKPAEPPKPAAASASAAVPSRPAPAPASPSPPAPGPMNQHDIDSMLAGLDAPPSKPNGKMSNKTDVLELTESMAASSEPPVFRTVESHADVFFTEADEQQQLSEGVADAGEQQQTMMTSAELPLISSSTRAAVDSAFNSLAHTVLAQNARTLEDLVKEMMRPMLKAWLDDNLPGLV